MPLFLRIRIICRLYFVWNYMKLIHLCTFNQTIVWFWSLNSDKITTISWKNEPFIRILIFILIDFAMFVAIFQVNIFFFSFFFHCFSLLKHRNVFNMFIFVYYVLLSKFYHTDSIQHLQGQQTQQILWEYHHLVSLKLFRLRYNAFTLTNHI